MVSPNISFRVEDEFKQFIDNKALELGITRGELLRNIVYNILNYPVTDKPFKTLTVGKLMELLEPLPCELPLIAYTEEADYALDELKLLGLIGGLKLTKFDKNIDKIEWELTDLIKK